MTALVPEALRDAVAGYDRSATSLGDAAETYRLTAPGRPALYLKIADDLALALRHIEADFGPSWRQPFARAYGITALDESKLAFFALLDELF